MNPQPADPAAFVVSFGVVSALADIVYEGARPFRFRCVGYDQFRTDVSYPPDLKAYLAPPFGGKEAMMLTWSTMLPRRPRPPAKTQKQVIQADGVVLDVPRRRAQVDGYLVHLPAREAAVLGVLLAHAGQGRAPPALADAAGDIDQAHHRDLDRLMHRLRRRIEPSPLSQARIHRVDDTGYLFGSTARAASGEQDERGEPSRWTPPAAPAGASEATSPTTVLRAERCSTRT